MKTYLLDILNRYNKFSETLDAKTILCNKPWLIFNDCGNKELYIFQENGSLIASINGNVTNATWQYIPANKSLVISFKEQSYMLHPSFIDNTIFALQQDGTEKYLFMINEQQCNTFYPKSHKELNSYFEGLERKSIQEKELQKQRLIEQQKAEQQLINEEFWKQEQNHLEQEKKQQEQEKKVEEERRIEEKRLTEIFNERQILKQYKIFILSQVIGYLIMIAISIKITVLAYNTATDSAWIIVPPMIFGILYFLIYRNFIRYLKTNLLKREESARKQKIANIQWIKKESDKIEDELNNIKDIIDYKRRLLLKAEELTQKHKQIYTISNRKSFAIYWDTTTMEFKNISLVIYNGKKITRFEGLENRGRKEICLRRVHSPVKIMLIVNWFDTLIYKVTFVFKKKSEAYLTK